MSKQALIIIDLQNDYFEGGKWELHNINQAAANARQVLDNARNKSIPVLHVRHEFPTDEAPFFAPGSTLRHKLKITLTTGFKSFFQLWAGAPFRDKGIVGVYGQISSLGCGPQRQAGYQQSEITGGTRHTNLYSSGNGNGIAW